MPVTVDLITNCDDAVVFWRIAKAIPDCLGFYLEREQRLADGSTQVLTLHNRKGFKADRPKVGETRSSLEWPFQRFWWADHSANLGDTVRYRVCPVVARQGQHIELTAERSAWTAWATLSGGSKDGFACFFNRGHVISQFMARYLEDLRRRHRLATRKEALRLFRASITDHELPMRRFLAGALRTALLDLLAGARTSRRHVYAALYEFEDEELVQALCALKSRAHVVLANGSITARAGETAAAARQRDQNEAGRAALRRAGATVHDRMVSPGALGHNKFMVLTDTAGAPQQVWTGSTNWTPTGLCTQVNNALVMRHRGIAAEFHAQWQRLRDAGSGFPSELVDANSVPARHRKGASSTDVWFTRTRGGVDLKAIDAVLEAARDGILFLMFQPGGTGTLATVRALQKRKPGLYLKGVVSTLPDPQEAAPDEVGVTLFGAATKGATSLDIVAPEGLKAPFANWAATVTRNEFLVRQGGVVGNAIVHSKLIVVDPFSNPVVISGSHNFSASASKKNDENFVIVSGNAELARSYAAHILSVYHQYRWMVYASTSQGQGERRKGDGYLKESDAWQAAELKGGGLREMQFWSR